MPLSEWASAGGSPGAAVAGRFGFAESIAVNLPNRLFERVDLVEPIHQAVTRSGVPHRTIEIEITGDRADEAGVGQRAIRRCTGSTRWAWRSRSTTFGTGYSSLAYLTNMPISEPKIDRSFVRELGRAEEFDIVTAIVAPRVRLRVGAEGVETLRQMEVLHRLGCRLMQGFLFSRPLPPEEMRGLARADPAARQAT